MDRNGQLTQAEIHLGSILYNFRAIDKNGDEAITREELTDYLRKAGYNTNYIDRHVAKYFDLYDSNDDNKLGILEFVSYYSAITLNPSAEELREGFRALDKNGDGLVSEDELRRYFTVMKPEVASLAGKIILGLDKDGDGMLNFEELAKP